MNKSKMIERLAKISYVENVEDMREAIHLFIHKLHHGYFEGQKSKDLDGIATRLYEENH